MNPPPNEEEEEDDGDDGLYIKMPTKKGSRREVPFGQSKRNESGEGTDKMGKKRDKQKEKEREFDPKERAKRYPNRYPDGDEKIDLGAINLALGSDIAGRLPMDIEASHGGFPEFIFGDVQPPGSEELLKEGPFAKFAPSVRAFRAAEQNATEQAKERQRQYYGTAPPQPTQSELLNQKLAESRQKGKERADAAGGFASKHPRFAPRGPREAGVQIASPDSNQFGALFEGDQHLRQGPFVPLPPAPPSPPVPRHRTFDVLNNILVDGSLEGPSSRSGPSGRSSRGSLSSAIRRTGPSVSHVEDVAEIEDLETFLAKIRAELNPYASAPLPTTPATFSGGSTTLTAPIGQIPAIPTTYAEDTTELIAPAPIGQIPATPKETPLDSPPSSGLSSPETVIWNPLPSQPSSQVAGPAKSSTETDPADTDESELSLTPSRRKKIRSARKIRQDRLTRFLQEEYQPYEDDDPLPLVANPQKRSLSAGASVPDRPQSFKPSSSNEPRLRGGGGCHNFTMQRTPSNSSLASSQGPPNGNAPVPNGAAPGPLTHPSALMPATAGQQMDIHMLYQKVLELSDVLRDNREKTQGIVASAEELATRAASSSAGPDIKEADREISSARIAALTRQNHSLARAKSVLANENRENTRLIGEYETALGTIVDMVRDLAVKKDGEKLGLAREYNARLQEEKEAHLGTRLERDEWHAKAMRGVEMLRTALRLREEEVVEAGGKRLGEEVVSE